MKFLTYMIPALAALVSAGKVDECAGSCISKAISATGCASTDSSCICAADSFLQTVQDCGPCSEDGKDAAVALAEDYCGEITLSKRQWGGLYKGHPIERWFANHPDYLKNHPGWLNRHSDWATAHSDFLTGHLGHPWSPPPPSHPQPPSYPHHPAPPPYQPTHTHHHPHPGHYTTHKPSPTVYP